MKKESLTGDDSTLPEAFHNISDYDIYIYPNGIDLFIGENGELLTSVLPYIIAPEGVRNIAYSEDSSKILFWTKNKINVIDFSGAKKEGVFEKGPLVTEVVNNAKDIKQAFWVNKGSHILFLDENYVRLSEFDTSGVPMIFPIIDVKGPIFYDDTTGSLYYLDKKTAQLESITIVPSHETFSFKLPKDVPQKEETN